MTKYSDLEIMVQSDMIDAGYNPSIWADVVEYWNERFNVETVG
jgi:hypothetical protein